MTLAMYAMAAEVLCFGKEQAAGVIPGVGVTVGVGAGLELRIELDIALGVMVACPGTGPHPEIDVADAINTVSAATRMALIDCRPSWDTRSRTQGALSAALHLLHA